PSAKSSTSPASTILTALSTLPLHSGNAVLAFSATSATASRHAVRAGLPKSAEAMSSQANCATIVIVSFLFLRGLDLWACDLWLAALGHAPMLFQHDSALSFALALAGLSPCRSLVSALSRPFSLAQRHRHVVLIS